jgi:hypothetical protein
MSTGTPGHAQSMLKEQGWPVAHRSRGLSFSDSLDLARDADRVELKLTL